MTAIAGVVLLAASIPATAATVIWTGRRTDGADGLLIVPLGMVLGAVLLLVIAGWLGVTGS